MNKTAPRGKGRRFLLTDTNGKASASFTFLAVTFTICSLWLALNVFEDIGGWNVREFDATGAAAWITPFAVLYFGRRYTTTTTPGDGGDDSGAQDKEG